MFCATLVRRRDIEVAEQMRLVTVERSDGTLMVRLAHPLFSELRRATAGELYLSRIRGRLARRLAERADADMHATVQRALLTLESDIELGGPAHAELFLRRAICHDLLDLQLADRFATAAAEAGAAEAVVCGR